ncbi:MAG: glucokinase [Pseudomonadota bacterium]
MAFVQGARLGLVADVGGTNARFALALLRPHGSGSRCDLHAAASLHAADYPSLAAAGRAYLDEIVPGMDLDEVIAKRVGSPPRPKIAAFAIAGPILGEEVRFTNSPWSFNTAELADALRVHKLLILNDFEALANGLPFLKPEECHRIGGGEATDDGAISVVGPGTGLGVGSIVPVTTATGRHWHALPAEGGHVDLAARTPREFAIVQSMMKAGGRVSAERALSGPGLEAIHTAILSVDGHESKPATAAEITERALAGGDALADETVRLFVTWLGRLSGDVALTVGSRGGVFIGGGICPRILPLMERFGFRAAFEDKGRLKPFVEAVPTQVILSNAAALTGAGAALAQAEGI